MRKSGLMDKLHEKYRGQPLPASRHRRKGGMLVPAIGAGALAVVILLNILFATGVLPAGSDTVEGDTWPTMMPTSTLVPGTTAGAVVVDMGSHAQVLNISEKRINQPSVYGTELLFSAGNGTLDKPVLQTLYLFDTQTEKLTKITTSQLKDGEIYEAYISQDWLVWLDTDHKGTNVIYKMNRKAIDDMKAGTITEVRQTENHSPKLRLYGDLLVWMEQIGDSDDQLYIVDLKSGEDLALQEFTEITYALSAPYIYQRTVIWAGPDPDQSAEEKEAGETSAIYMVEFAPAVDANATDAPDATATLPAVTEDPNATPDPNATEDPGNELTPVLYKPGMYVHEPMSNGEVVVWIDKNKAPDSNLYMSLEGGAPVLIHKNVTSYSLGNDFIVYNYNQTVYAYYYKKDVTVQVSEDGKPSILPQTQGNLIVWEDKTPGQEKDTFKYNLLG